MPLLDLFLIVLEFALFVALIWIIILILTDIVRSRDLSGWAKALWILVVVFLAWLGIFIYMVVRGRGMAERGSHWAFGEDLAS